MNRFRDQRKDHDRSGHRSGDQQRACRRVADIWPGYLSDGYFDENGFLRQEYVSRENVEPLAEAMAQAKPALTMSQMRRFFQHCRRIENRLRLDGEEWGKVLPKVLFLDAAAQDAWGKTEPKIPELFFDFIRRNVAAVRGPRDFFDGFIPHFEALVGFGATHIKNR